MSSVLSLPPLPPLGQMLISTPEATTPPPAQGDLERLLRDERGGSLELEPEEGELLERLRRRPQDRERLRREELALLRQAALRVYGR